MISDANALALVAVASVFSIPLLAFVRTHSLSNPGAFFGIVWAVATAPAIALAPSAVTDRSILVIAGFALCAAVGSAIGESLSPSRAAENPGARAREWSSVRVTTACSALGGIGGLLAAAGYLAGSGYSLSELTRPDAWLAVAAQYSIARYQEGFVEPVAIRVLLAANYAGALFGGLVLAAPRTRMQAAAGALPIVASVLVTLITTAKGSMLIAILLTASTALAARTRPGRRRSHSTTGALLTASGILVATIGSLGLRYGGNEADLAATISQKLGGYFVGHVAAFSAWLQWEGPWHIEPSWGRNTFAGLSELLGGATREAGIYRELALNPVAAESNVFTAFRGLILDFTLPGALAVVTLASGAAGHAWQRVREGFGGARSLLVLVAYLAFVGWSPVISVFVYNVILLALSAFALVIAGMELHLTDRGDRS